MPAVDAKGLRSKIGMSSTVSRLQHLIISMVSDWLGHEVHAFRSSAVCDRRIFDCTNDSDVFDQFQLHHLALDGYVIVTHDKKMSERTATSPQASRIMSFEDFLRSL